MPTVSVTFASPTIAISGMTDPADLDLEDPHVVRSLAAILECAIALDRSPTTTEYDDWRHRHRPDALEEFPSAAYIRTHCGGWNAAKAALGLACRSGGGSEPPDLDDAAVDWRWDELATQSGRDRDDLPPR